MISGLLNVSQSPKTNIIHLWRAQDALNNPRNNPNTFSKVIIFIDLKLLGIQCFEKLGKDERRTILEFHLWDQYLPENMK